jgi:hypothetical protein
MKPFANSQKLGIALMLTAALAAKGQNIISWNYDVYGTLQPACTAGVVAVCNWNDSFTIDGNALNATEDNLMDNTGVPTTLSLTELGCNNSWNRHQINATSPDRDADGSYNRRLLNGYISKGGDETTTGSLPAGHSGLVLNNIPYAVYKIYVYFSSDVAGRVGTVTIGNTTYDFTTMGPASISGTNAFFVQTTDDEFSNPRANYAVFTGLTGKSQTIDVYVKEWGGIAGIQIVKIK